MTAPASRDLWQQGSNTSVSDTASPPAAELDRRPIIWHGGVSPGLTTWHPAVSWHRLPPSASHFTSPGSDGRIGVRPADANTGHSTQAPSFFPLRLAPSLCCLSPSCCRARDLLPLRCCIFYPGDDIHLVSAQTGSSV